MIDGRFINIPENYIFFEDVKRIGEDRPLYILTDFDESEDIVGSYMGAGCMWAQVHYLDGRDYVSLYRFGSQYPDTVSVNEYGKKWFAYMENF